MHAKAHGRVEVVGKEGGRHTTLHRLIALRRQLPSRRYVHRAASHTQPGGLQGTYVFGHMPGGRVRAQGQGHMGGPLPVGDGIWASPCTAGQAWAGVGAYAEKQSLWGMAGDIQMADPKGRMDSPPLPQRIPT